MNPTVLIVEDQMLVAHSLRLMLQRLGYAVAGIAVSGEEAVALALQSLPDLILMDIQLQGQLDGVEAAERIRLQHDLAIVYVTANTDEATLRRAKLTEPLGYICKPFEQWQLRVAVEMALHNHQVRRQLKESQQRYRLLFESNPRPMWVYDLESLAFLSVNQAAIDQYGYSREEFLAMTGKDIRPPEDVPAFVASASSPTLGMDHPGIWRHRKKDGSLMMVEIVSHTMDFAGRPAKLVLATDVTEKLEMEKAFLRAQRLESLGTLAAGIAHDLNNILAPVMMASQVLQQQPREKQDAELIAAIQRSAKRAGEVVRQVLTFGRGIEGQRVPVQPRHLLKEMLRIMRETFPRNLTLRANLAPDLWTVIGDATQLHQVLMNLCVNARDAMPNGGTLHLAAWNVQQLVPSGNTFGPPTPGPHVLLEVADSGHGVPPEILDKIFDPFFTTKAHGKGTGLGLSTTLGIVKSHGGFLTVETDPGRGATFRVHLPAAPASALPASPPQDLPHPDGKGQCILVVDDEPAVREVTRKTLARFGYAPLVACHGREALELFERHHARIQAVVTDLMMPVMDGLALVQALRRTHPQLQIVACTGLPTKELERQLNSLGVQTVLQKPFPPQTLLNALSQPSPLPSASSAISALLPVNTLTP